MPVILYGRIHTEVIACDSGAHYIVDSLYRFDAPIVVIEIYGIFNEFLSTHRGAKELFNWFASRFTAKVANLNSFSISTRIPQ